MNFDGYGLAYNFSDDPWGAGIVGDIMPFDLPRSSTTAGTFAFRPLARDGEPAGSALVSRLYDVTPRYRRGGHSRLIDVHHDVASWPRTRSADLRCGLVTLSGRLDKGRQTQSCAARSGWVLHPSELLHVLR